jgi:RHS repeat-associated protein
MYILAAFISGILRSRVAAIACLMVGASVSAWGQAPGRPDRGIKAAASYSVSDIENISLSNGNVNVSIPLAGLPPMSGGELSWTVSAIYNSKTWDMVRDERRIPLGPGYVVESLQESDAGKWIVGGAYGIVFRESRADFNWQDPLAGDPDEGILVGQHNWFKVLLSTPDGAEHELRPLGVLGFPGSRDYLRGYYGTIPGTNGNPMVYYSFDGSYLWAVVNPDNGNYPIRWEIYLPDGTKIVQRRNGIQRITDTNGNRIEIFSTEDSPGVITTHYRDQETGREVQRVSSSNGIQVRYQTVDGVWIAIDLSYGFTTVKGKTFTVTDDNGQGGTCERKTVLPQTTLYVLRSITLPATEPGQPARQYVFSYSSDEPFSAVSLLYQDFCGQPPQTVTSASRGMGSLSQITTPMGATIKYSYSSDSVHALIFVDDATKETIRTKTVVHDGVTDVWNYDINELGGAVSNPDGTGVTESKYPQSPGLPGYLGGFDGKAGLVYRTRTADKIIERHWTPLLFSGGDNSSAGGLVTFNPAVDAEYTTLLNSAGQPLKMSARTFQYDFNGNLTQETAYDWFSPTVTRDAEGVPTGVPAGAAVLRVTTNSYYNPAGSASSANVYAKRSNTIPPTPLILNAIRETATGASRTQFSYDGLGIGTAPTAGNLTKESRWDDHGNRWLETVHTYDPDTGNRTSTRDPKNNLITYSYTDAAQAQPNLITVDPQNGTGQQVSQIAYDHYTGLVRSQTDVNGQVTTTDYTNHLLGAIDPYGRPGTVTGPPVNVTVDGVTLTNQQRKVVTRYHDTQRSVEVWTDLNVSGDQKLKSKTVQDSLGRVIRTESSEDGTNYTISTVNNYQQMGRITSVSNPKRAGAAATDGWTRTTRDNAGRVNEVASFSGAGLPPASGTNANWSGSVLTTYNGEETTVRDQAGKKRKSVVDGLGRLVSIAEDPDGLNYLTSYRYDVLGNLTRVNQGSQVREFTYDSLSRLRTAKNPEQVNLSGQMVATTYAYDEASNLRLRTNPNGTTVEFTYDGLNRVRTKTMSVGGSFTYSYDTATNGKGRLASVTASGGDGYYYDGYDAAGQITASHQITTATSGQQSYAMSYRYDLAGAMTSATYPSGKEYRTGYDNAGRVSQVSRYVSGLLDKTYASGFIWTAHGAMAGLSLSNVSGSPRMVEQTSYNSRLQPTKMEMRKAGTNELLLGLDYGYGTTANNGNMQTQGIRIGGTGAAATWTMQQSFSYDGLNRLDLATEGGGWSQDYDYDRYGNRCVSAGLILPENVGQTPQTLNAFNGATNRLVASSYDASGNQLQDAGGRSFTYDAENRQLTFNGTAATYVYDGDGRRVKKTDGTGTTVFVYNAVGQLVAEYTSGVAQPNGTSYLTTDHVGSTRLVTDSSGVVKARHDYMPFGEEVPSSQGVRGSVSGYAALDGTRQRFTSKERDVESGLDYFLARYYSSAQGRFTSPDEFTGGPAELYRFAARASENPTLYADPFAPQSFNKYQYCTNNPLRYVDPDGHQERDRYGRTTTPAPPLTAPPDVARFLAERTHENLIAAGDAIINAAKGGYRLLSRIGNFINKNNTTDGIRAEDVDGVEPETAKEQAAQPQEGQEGEQPQQPQDPQEPKASDLKRLSSGEIKTLQGRGIDVHDLKSGQGPPAQFDLYKDKHGNIFILRKGGRGEPDPTGLNIKPQ